MGEVNLLAGWLGILAGMIVGAITMPTVCFLSAWREPFRHFFFIPVSLLLGGVVLTLIELSF